jgi:hypothetical protein
MQRGCSSVRPLIQRALVGLPRRFLSPSPVAARPRSLHSSPGSHACVARSGYRTMPFPHHRPCRTPSLPAPLTYVAVTCVARSLAVHLSLIAVGRAAEPAMAAGVHVPWRLRSSPTEPRAPASMAGVSGARTPRLATGSHPDGRNRLAQPSLPYVVYVCLKCFRCMLQLFHLDVAKVDWGCRTCCIC